MRCWPESAAEKVNLPSREPRWATMRWLLSKVSSTVMKTPVSGFDSNLLVASLHTSAW
jgi:hypothetical protein